MLAAVAIYLVEVARALWRAFLRRSDTLPLILKIKKIGGKSWLNVLKL